MAKLVKRKGNQTRHISAGEKELFRNFLVCVGKLADMGYSIDDEVLENNENYVFKVEGETYHFYKKGTSDQWKAISHGIEMEKRLRAMGLAL